MVSREAQCQDQGPVALLEAQWGNLAGVWGVHDVIPSPSLRCGHYFITAHSSLLPYALTTIQHKKKVI